MRCLRLSVTIGERLLPKLLSCAVPSITEIVKRGPTARLARARGTVTPIAESGSAERLCGAVQGRRVAVIKVHIAHLLTCAVPAVT